MSFLLRMAFWLGLVLVLLPREKTPEADKAPQIGATEAVSAATAAISDVSQFCKRQPAACEVGGHAATAGAPDKKPDHTSSIETGDNGDAVVTATAPASDALSEADVAIEWRMPRPKGPN
jgi:hypothetical protein